LVFVGTLFLHKAFSEVRLVGNATYYSNHFDGRATSGGELFQKNSFTCAHRTFPFGTVLKVRSLSNSRQVYVTVNDRGPFTHAIIDLSYAAAECLCMIEKGVEQVEITTVHEVQRIPYRWSDKTYIPRISVYDVVFGCYLPLAEWSENKCKYSKCLSPIVDEEDGFRVVQNNTRQDLDFLNHIFTDENQMRQNWENMYKLQ